MRSPEKAILVGGYDDSTSSVDSEENFEKSFSISEGNKHGTLAVEIKLLS